MLKNNSLRIGHKIDTASLAVSAEYWRYFVKTFGDGSSISAIPGDSVLLDKTFCMSLTGRLLGCSPITGPDIIEFGVDDISWPNTVKIGDIITAKIEVAELHGDIKQPSYGLVGFDVDTETADGRQIQKMKYKILIPTPVNG